MTSADHEIDLEVAPQFAEEVDSTFVVRHVVELLHAERAARGAGLSIRIAGDDLLRELNRIHRGIDEPTDVLSFGADEGEAFPVIEGEAAYLGDIAVSAEAVRRQALDAGLPFESELAHVILHGALHLLGYDHDTEEADATMRAREEALLGPGIHAQGHSHSDD